ISKAGTFIDADAAYDYLLKERGMAEEKIVLFGRSLGSALAVYLATKFRPGSLIIESAFTSSDDVANLYYPFLKHLLKTSANYETSGLIGEIEVPKLIIHGERDEIIPLWMGKKLYDLSTGQKEMYIIPGAAHNDTYIVGGEEYFKIYFRLKRIGVLLILFPFQ
ncbi:MAG: alpha/beta hydrolase, partial [Planctomycetota bacterium]